MSSRTSFITSSPGLAGRLGLRGVRGGDAGEAARADAEEVDHERHRVGGELAAAGAGARAGDRLERVHLLVGHPARRRARRRPRRRPGSSRRGPRSGRARSSRCRRRARGCRAARAPSPRPGSSCRSRRGRRARRSRWPATTSSIESAITSREISEARIPVVPIETPSETEIVLNSIGVPPAARMPVLDVPREHALVEVARHRLDPGRRDADERLREILVGEADRLQHRPRGRAVDAVGRARRCGAWRDRWAARRRSCGAPSLAVSSYLGCRLGADGCRARRSRAGARAPSSAALRARRRRGRCVLAAPRRRPTGPSPRA